MENGQFTILLQRPLSQLTKTMLVILWCFCMLIVVFQCSDLHPDGHVYAIGGADGTIRVYDVITGQLNGTLGPRPGGVKSIHFSSNGYWLAETSDADSVVRVWDLRKAQSVAHELNGSSIGGKVRWDRTGQYLALGGDKGVDVWGYQKKSKVFEKVTDGPLESGGVMCLDWTLDATIACGGLSDGSICLLGVKDA
jgi:pre-mRNA-processing factor 19